MVYFPSPLPRLLQALAAQRDVAVRGEGFGFLPQLGVSGSTGRARGKLGVCQFRAVVAGGWWSRSVAPPFSQLEPLWSGTFPCLWGPVCCAQVSHPNGGARPSFHSPALGDVRSFLPAARTASLPLLSLPRELIACLVLLNTAWQGPCWQSQPSPGQPGSAGPVRDPELLLAASSGLPAWRGPRPADAVGLIPGSEFSWTRGCPGTARSARWAHPSLLGPCPSLLRPCPSFSRTRGPTRAVRGPGSAPPPRRGAAGAGPRERGRAGRGHLGCPPRLLLCPPLPLSARPSFPAGVGGAVVGRCEPGGGRRGAGPPPAVPDGAFSRRRFAEKHGAARASGSP